MSLTVAHERAPRVDDVEWLSPHERQSYEGFRDRSRRRTWLAGRWLARKVVLARLGWPATPAAGARLEICSRDGLGRAVAPRVLVDGQAQPWSLSIAHGETSLLVALSCDREVRVGVDLVPRAAGDARALDGWLTSREREWLDTIPHEERATGVSTLWAIKEAAYKAAGDGTRFVPRRVEAWARENVWHARIEDGSIDVVVRVGLTDADVAAVVTATGPWAKAWR
jgi:phosphopantetheinyl transferase